MKTEDFSTKKRGKREYLNNAQTSRLIKGLNEHFQSMVNIPRIRMGERQEIETLINEEASLFVTFLRGERQSWKPRIAEL
jgi:CRISPR/Cas system-associated endonuclease Cas1